MDGTAIWLSSGGSSQLCPFPCQVDVFQYNIQPLDDVVLYDTRPEYDILKEFHHVRGIVEQSQRCDRYDETG